MVYRKDSSCFIEVLDMNRKHVAWVLLVTFLICGIGSNTALSQNLTKEWVRKMASPLVENRVADGLSIGYLEGEHWGIVHLGTANQDKQTADFRTVYEIGSVSKVFTSLLLADAVVRGEIDLDAAAQVANPAGIQFPSYNDTPITWLDLSTHRSGLPRLPTNFQPTDMVNPYRNYDSKEAAAFLKEYELPRKPGESQEYSNFATSVLGYLVAQKAGESYEQLLQERIAEPLGMDDCTISLSSDQKKRLAQPHSKFGSPTSRWTFADLPGAGGISASMRDMMRFAKAQLDPPSGKLGEAIELAWKQHGDADASGAAMGLGWMIAGDGQTRWHNGQTGGSRSALFINRELKCAVIVLCNTSLDTGVDELAMKLVLKAAGQEVEQEPVMATEEEQDDVEIDAKLRSRLVGRYQLAPELIFDVNDEDGHLMVSVTNQPTMEVFPDSATQWSPRGFDAQLEFKLGKTGPATKLILHQNGNRQSARRIEPERENSDDEAGELVVDAKLRRRLEGRYQLTPNFIFDVEDDDGHLMVGITNQPTQEVFPDSATLWSYRGVDAQLEFKLSKTGPARKLVLLQDGNRQTARRIK